jgi:hypothetical protein
MAIRPSIAMSISFDRDISGSYGTMGVKYKNGVENMLNERYHRTHAAIELNYAYIL